MNEWYQSLTKPFLNPPGWVFGPVWTVLYIMITLSILLFLKNVKNSTGYNIYILLGIHIISNFAWTSIFFGLKSPFWALLDLVVLDITLVFLITNFWQVSKVSSILLWPYLLWVLFATYLNAGIWWLNRT